MGFCPLGICPHVIFSSGIFSSGIFSSWDFFLHGILSSWDFFLEPNPGYGLAALIYNNLLNLILGTVILLRSS